MQRGGTASNGVLNLIGSTASTGSPSHRCARRSSSQPSSSTGAGCRFPPVTAAEPPASTACFVPRTHTRIPHRAWSARARPSLHHCMLLAVRHGVALNPPTPKHVTVCVVSSCNTAGMSLQADLPPTCGALLLPTCEPRSRLCGRLCSPDRQHSCRLPAGK